MPALDIKYTIERIKKEILVVNGKHIKMISNNQ